MSDHNLPLLSTLPIELVYRILNHLKTYNILISAYRVCARLDAIIDTYHASEVKLIGLCYKEASSVESEIL